MRACVQGVYPHTTDKATSEGRGLACASPWRDARELTDADIRLERFAIEWVVLRRLDLSTEGLLADLEDRIKGSAEKLERFCRVGAEE